MPAIRSGGRASPSSILNIVFRSGVTFMARYFSMPATSCKMRQISDCEKCATLSAAGSDTIYRLALFDLTTDLIPHPDQVRLKVPFISPLGWRFSAAFCQADNIGPSEAQALLSIFRP